MKSTLWLAAFTMAASSPLSFSNPSELEALRSTVAEQERQIRQLEDDNMKLRSARGENVIPPSAMKAAASTGSAAEKTYTVRAGDTLAKIGRNTASTPQAIARLNGIKNPSKLKIGQKLKIPSSAPVVAAAAPAPSPAPAAPAEPKAIPGSDTYIVRNGETFYSIARKHSVSPESLVAANPGIKASELRTGQVIRLSTRPSGAAAQAPATRRATETVAASRPANPAPAPSPAAPESNVPAQAGAAKKTAVHSVTIDGEMTYGEFAAKHGTRVEQLNALNGLDLHQNTVLAKGSELYVAAQP